MIYSNSNKFMFYHIPKTAGQSLHNVLRKYTVGDHVNEYYVTRDMTHTAVEHTWDKYKGSEYFSFAIVRNPYDRMFSLYNFLTRIGLINEPLEQFINNMDREPSQFRLLNHNGVVPLSFVGKFENLEEDFNFIADKINIDERCTDLPKVNMDQTSNITYKEAFNNELKDIIDKKHHDDFINFNYEKQL
tara:strand:- start:532 stop:1095 length:564 start_codon:yes stop_codon:yes gene_type:complete